jgi:hypothetical protein
MARATFTPMAIVKGIANLGRIITGSITGPLILTPSDNPLTIASTGKITSTGANNDGVDGAASTAWTITNKGTISSDGGWGVDLAGAGVLDNSGVLSGLLGGFEAAGIGVVTNDGTISGTGPESYGVLLDDGGNVTNKNGGSISAFVGIAVDIEGGFGAVTNNGAISGQGGILLNAGGSVTNNKGGSVTGSGAGRAGVEISNGLGVVANNGTISGQSGGLGINGTGVVLDTGGSVTNNKSGIIESGLHEGGGVYIGGFGTVTNKGEIDSTGNAVEIDGGGSVTNTASGVISAGDRFSTGVDIAGGFGIVTNAGAISATETGVFFEAGGSLTNASSGIISGGGPRGAGVEIGGASGEVTNTGTISGSGNGDGVSLDVGGSVTNRGTISGGSGIVSDGIFISTGNVTNEAGSSISGAVNGIETGGGPVTVTNAGTILGGTDSVLFGSGSSDNRLVIAPGAVFNGAADATAATNSEIELAKGVDAIHGIGNGKFLGFTSLVADGGANWTLTGANMIGTVLDDGKLEVFGGLAVTSAVDPTSTGAFVLDHGSTLEVAAAVGANSTMSFAAGSKLVVDDFALFGENVGTDNYAGSSLKDFGGSTIDLKDFGIAGLQDSFSASSGLLQLTNSAAQVATLDFQTSSLGAGTFHFGSDGAGGLLVKHS